MTVARAAPPFARRATLQDVPAIVALVNSAYRGESSRAGWTTEADLLGGIRIDAERVAEAIESADRVILVHDTPDGIVACVQLERTGADCYLGMLTTKPTRQGEGLGRRMVEASEQWAIDHWQSGDVHMTVIAQREELLAWYERLGYARTGERKPFPYGDERWGVPARPDLEFLVLRKALR